MNETGMSSKDWHRFSRHLKSLITEGMTEVPIASTFRISETSKTSKPSKPVINKPKTNPNENKSLKSSNKKAFSISLTKQQYEEHFKKWDIDHGEDPDKFVTIIEKDRLNSIAFWNKMETDAWMYSYIKKVKEVFNEYMDITEHSEQYKNEEIDFSDHFSLELVKERLDGYNISKTPDLQVLANIMIILYIHPVKIKTLQISNGDITGYAKNWRQQYISQVFKLLEKNEKWVKQLLIWIQEAISFGQLKDSGVSRMVFAIVIYEAKNLSEAITIAKTDKQNAEVYIVLSGENRILKKQLKDYHSQHNILEKRVKRLERDVNSLNSELEDLSECIEDLDECSSEDSDLVKTFVIREGKAIPHKEDVHLIILINIPSKSTSFETSSSESSLSESSSSFETSLFELSILELSSFETNSSKSSSFDSDINEIVNMIKYQRIWERLI
ncbi:hypothetical protein C1645_813136 [Glomus cerebriforme]|uniref:Uncharacterized protein n=1 Tax=Glomus cerebriforme TaxID=658196 RepID=A0A397TNK5_9GLOM|nr:hypothetical protein C1645_813136 [Glomus cerebriforme]